MDQFDVPPMYELYETYDLSQLDPAGGVLVMTTYWRARPHDPDPERPGEKLTMLSYVPTAPEERCPCGSGKPFSRCCQALPYWHLLCPNPAMDGYSRVASQTATFAPLSAAACRELYVHLQADERLYCVEDMLQKAFWVHWGDPVVEAPDGIVCFGDVELRRQTGTLVVGALSDRRMQALLDLLRPLDVGTPQLQRDPVAPVEKPTRGPLDRPARGLSRRSNRPRRPGRPHHPRSPTPGS